MSRLDQQIRYRNVPPFNKDQRWFTPHNFFVQLDGVLETVRPDATQLVARKGLA